MDNKDQVQSYIGQNFIAQSHDLAVTLEGEQGRFVATTPSGDALLVDTQPGHSISGLRVLPKAEGAIFQVAKVADIPGTQIDSSSVRGRESAEGQGQQGRFTTVPVTGQPTR